MSIAVQPLDLIDTREFALIVRRRPKSIRRWAAGGWRGRGEFPPPVVIGRQLFWDRSAAMAFVASLRKSEPQELCMA